MYPKELNFPWPFPEKHTLIYNLKSQATIAMVYLLSKCMFLGINKMVVSNKNVMMNLLEDRSRGLLTVSNHRCNVDDPLLWSMFTFREFFRNISRFRYTLAAHNICFTRPLHTKFFSLGRCVPCVRGAGVYQIGVDYCVDVLSKKGWVHLFPEGRVTKEPIRIKWGVSRLISEAEVPPILLPIWIEGMQDVWAEKPPYYPKFGKTVKVIVGEPIDMITELPTLRTANELETRKNIADFVQAKLFALQNQN